MKIKMSKSKSSNECFYSPKIYARQILKDVFEKFETEKGFFYSFLKNYVLDFENNDEYINSNLKNVVVFLLKYSKDVGEKTALQNLALCLKDMNKNVTN
ncbi:hypothetical protein IJ670_03125, partial [bacterium]|nr:hypothetical protein [bacterium]